MEIQGCVGNRSSQVVPPMLGEAKSSAHLGVGKECLRCSQQQREKASNMDAGGAGIRGSREGPRTGCCKVDVDWVCGDFSYGGTEALRVRQGTLGSRPKQWVSGSD